MSHLKFNREQFTGILLSQIALGLNVDEAAQMIADKADSIYLQHVFDQPRLYGIISENHDYNGFDDHEGAYDNTVGYLVERREIKKNV